MGDIAISGSIMEKIARAREIYERAGEFLLHEDEPERLLLDFQQAATRSRAGMEKAGLRLLWCRD